MSNVVYAVAETTRKTNVLAVGVPHDELAQGLQKYALLWVAREHDGLVPDILPFDRDIKDEKEGGLFLAVDNEAGSVLKFYRTFPRSRISGWLDYNPQHLRTFSIINLPCYEEDAEELEPEAEIQIERPTTEEDGDYVPPDEEEEEEEETAES